MNQEETSSIGVTPTKPGFTAMKNLNQKLQIPPASCSLEIFVRALIFVSIGIVIVATLSSFPPNRFVFNLMFDSNSNSPGSIRVEVEPRVPVLQIGHARADSMAAKDDKQLAIRESFPSRSSIPTSEWTPSPVSQAPKPPSTPLRDPDFVHEMNDKELLKKARALSNTGNDPSKKIPRVAFMFLVKGHMHLIPLWERFFRGNQDLYSIYVHSNPSYNATFPRDSIFHGRRIPSKGVRWGDFNMVEAERRLLASSLLEPSNQWFVLLSESCIPLFNFPTVYSYLTNSTRTFVESYDLWGPVGRDRYSPRMKPTVTISQWRKGSQWFQIDRSLALQVVSDRKYFPVFKKYCKGSCYGDEHYLPTLVNIVAPQTNSNRTLTWVDWSKGGPHPRKFERPMVTIDFLNWLRNQRGCEYNGEKGDNICFLFARKFPPSSVFRLGAFAAKVLKIK